MAIHVFIKTDRTKIILRNTSLNAKKSMEAITRNLAKTSSQSAPHKKGILEDSWTREVGYDSSFRLTGTVSYSAMENGRNYAAAMHETDYNLGEGSLAKSGGRGMSGKSYPVGKKFLTNVLEGEKQTYRNKMAKDIKSGF